MIKETPFSKSFGAEITKYTLENKNGFSVSVINYGATVTNHSYFNLSGSNIFDTELCMRATSYTPTAPITKISPQPCLKRARVFIALQNIFLAKDKRLDAMRQAFFIMEKNQPFILLFRGKILPREQGRCVSR